MDVYVCNVSSYDGQVLKRSNQNIDITILIASIKFDLNTKISAIENDNV